MSKELLSSKQRLIKEYFQVRQFVYDVFRRFFIEEPSREYLVFCIQNKIFSKFPYQEIPAIEQGVSTITQYFNTHDVLNDQAKFDALHWEYTRLFVGPHTVVAPPWASFYLEKDKTLFQEITLQVRQMYQRYCFIAGEKINSEADDHIGFEFDFLYQLNMLSLSALEDNSSNESMQSVCFEQLLSDQHTFISAHMLAYVDKFRDSVCEHDKLGFYAALAQIVCAYLEVDQKMMSQIQTELKQISPIAVQ